MVTPATVAARRIHPVEALEQQRQVLVVNRRPRVAHGDADLLRPGIDLHLDHLVWRRMLHGVVQQVDQRPAQLGFLDGGVGIAAYVHANLRVFEDVVQVVERGRHFLCQRGLGQGSGLAALVGTGQKQHVVDDAAQAFQLFQVGLQHFEIMLGAAASGECDLGLADQVGER